jgi:hypothetical protein
VTFDESIAEPVSGRIGPEPVRYRGFGAMIRD